MESLTKQFESLGLTEKEKSKFRLWTESEVKNYFQRMLDMLKPIFDMTSISLQFLRRKRNIENLRRRFQRADAESEKPKFALNAGRAEWRTMKLSEYRKLV
eukprot:TRINITY_DN9663_c0_g1_i7.p1 TRINITY_DN9663_c0_g1~~TRINITY_DN9663_c0_g1_i7.p1  ORF type:complete len:101 (+),score=36.76 TRINITY_DN9663_c0_g1_i7:157-459(+)